MVSEILIGHNINKSSSDHGLIVVKKKTVTTLIRLPKGRTLFLVYRQCLPWIVETSDNLFNLCLAKIDMKSGGLILSMKCTPVACQS